MLVYGDRRREAAPRAALSALPDEPTARLIARGEIAQGLIDAEFEAAGFDDLTELHRAALADLRDDGDRLLGLALPGRVSVKEAEGFAFYAVYPQAYAAAARREAWDAPPFVIGLRSIGLPLAAVVAQAADAAEVVSLRPVGPPFRRTLRVSEGLRARLAAHAGPFALVDEGPGLSGSSFGAVLDLLQHLGVGLERVVVFPSHAGELGPEATPQHRARWRAVRRVVVTLDDLLAEQPIGELFADVTGPARAVEDLSGGAWRGGRPLPAWPQQERRKFRITTAEGRWLAKFAGLGAQGAAKLAAGRALAAWAPEPVVLRCGFLLTPWIDGSPARPRLDELAEYLSARTRVPAEAGASLAELAEMTAQNAAELGLSIAAPPPPAAGRRVWTDGRLHAWEWLRDGGGRLVKADALDHAMAHDLVGAQDIAWDVAGAEVELGLAEDEVRRLSARLGCDPDLLAFHRRAYPAFQAGLWSFAGDARQVARYRRALAAAS